VSGWREVSSRWTLTGKVPVTVPTAVGNGLSGGGAPRLIILPRHGGMPGKAPAATLPLICAGGRLPPVSRAVH
jgi:hypothetical protein